MEKELKKLSGENARLKSEIENLTTIIAEKDREIERLNKTIRNIDLLYNAESCGAQLDEDTFGKIG